MAFMIQSNSLRRTSLFCAESQADATTWLAKNRSDSRTLDLTERIT